MKHWVGQRVLVERAGGRKDPVQGILLKWDADAEIIVVGAKRVKIPFSQIVRIHRLPEDAYGKGKKRARSSIHTVGYVMRQSIQFDNAIYFKSAVTVWKGVKLISYRTTISSHDDHNVVLEDGTVLDKELYTFVVRSRRG
ncbi:hypothetical protein BK126_14115 [Paenibacillus sp. FSL H7-0326]|uniref:hypothetical protein n=1 Tax=Paenibacillus sp. FSL H7-0326 TaxID=1921144 RepID=UPI00096DA405|nr:hypothetical protein [Paenibacillus sp. FSL H7-0326]OMC68925.1 hypothetical protein BK126_14115 [Paenibacillus sp. FSL H7-0326]